MFTSKYIYSTWIGFSSGKHILKFIEKHLWEVEPESCELEETGKPEIEIMTQEEIDETERELISIGN